MRATLEQLKTMSDAALGEHWMQGRFPFEYIQTCGHCLTMHARCYAPEHADLRTQVQALPVSDCFNDIEGVIGELNIRDNLEALYDLRLFYDSLYPQPVLPSEQAVAESERSLAVA